MAIDRAHGLEWDGNVMVTGPAGARPFYCDGDLRIDDKVTLLCETLDGHLQRILALYDVDQVGESFNRTMGPVNLIVCRCRIVQFFAAPNGRHLATRSWTPATDASAYEGAGGFYCQSRDESRTWVRGHHSRDSAPVQAMLAAYWLTHGAQ